MGFAGVPRLGIGEARRSSLLIQDISKEKGKLVVASEKSVSIVGSDIDPLGLSDTSFNFNEEDGEEDATTSDSSVVRGNSVCVDNEMDTSDDENDDQLLRGIADDMIGRNVPFSRLSV